MGVEQDKVIRDQFSLTKEQLTIPDETGEVKRLWFESIVGFQLEGIDYGVRPQNLKGIIPLSWFEFWKSEVWNTWLKNLSYLGRRAAIISKRGLIRQTKHEPKSKVKALWI